MTKKELFSTADQLKQKISEVKLSRTDEGMAADIIIKREFIDNVAEMSNCTLTRADIDDIMAEAAKEQMNQSKTYGDHKKLKSSSGDNLVQENTSRKEKLWIKGVAKAYDYAMSCARTKDFNISLATIRQLHYLSYEAVSHEAGAFRKEKCQILDTEYQGAVPEELEHLTEHFTNQMNSSRRLLHPVEYAAICHKRIMDIYPFREGNGLIAILLMNMVLENEGYGVALIPSQKYSEYIHSLMTSQRERTPDFDVFIKFIAERVIEAESKQLDYLMK